MVSKLRKQPRTVAIMQPYIFPYIGYFQLIEKSDAFIFYDDVAFIKGGWIHSNKVLAPGGGIYSFSVSLDGGQSSSRSIANTPLSTKRDWQRKLTRTLRESYIRAPHVERVSALVDEVLTAPSESIADLACRSIRTICSYIGLTPHFEQSSHFSPETVNQGRTERLITMTHRLGGQRYLNLDGGRAFYNPTSFEASGIELRFLTPRLDTYLQGRRSNFAPSLSVIDILMWNQPEIVYEMAQKGRVAP